MEEQEKKELSRAELLGTVIEVNGEPCYTYKQLAAKYNVTHQTIFNWVKAGRLQRIDYLGMVTLYKEVADGESR